MKAKQLLWKDVSTLQLDYDVITSAEPEPDDPLSNDDPRLKGLSFSDCANDAFYVLVALTDAEDKHARRLKIRLGTVHQFKDNCATAKLSQNNLITDPEQRVEASNMSDLMTVQDSQKVLKDYYVRSISIVLDRGVPTTGTNYSNYKVKLREATVIALSDGKPIKTKATDFLLVVDNSKFGKITSLPKTGRSMLFRSQSGVLDSKISRIANQEITNVGDQLHGKLPDTLAKGVRYQVDLCLFGGRCLPYQGSFTAPD
ncbi:MAG: hypothetical protein ABI612_00975 [Betaproteobacteria bacterium]